MHQNTCGHVAYLSLPNPSCNLTRHEWSPSPDRVQRARGGGMGGAERTLIVAKAGKGTRYRFSFGPWNIHEGADPFGPTVREPIAFSKKLKIYKQLGFDGVQFHDDDAVPDVDGKSDKQILK